MNVELIALISGIIGLITGVVKLFSDVREKRKNHFKTFLNESQEISEYIDAFRAKYPDVQRVLVLQATNGGGVPRKDTPTKSSVLYESVNRNEFAPVQQYWQDVVLDGPYKRLLLEVISTEVDESVNYITVNPSEMPKYALLKSVYDANKVAASRIYPLKPQERNLLGIMPMSSKAYFYMSIPMNKEIKDNPEFDNDVSAMVRFLKQNL